MERGENGEVSDLCGTACSTLNPLKSGCASALQDATCEC